MRAFLFKTLIMINVEIKLQAAIKALDLNLLNEKEAKFINDIKNYEKKQLKKLSSAQYNWLEKIAKKANE